MNKQLAIVIFVILGISTMRAQLKYLNPEADLDSRVEDLISRLTLEEKVD